MILDAPPLLPVTDAALLLPSTDGALIIVDSTATRREHLEQSSRNIQAVNGHILGAVLNRVKDQAGSRYGYSKYGYGGAYTYEARPSSSDGKIVREPRRLIRREGQSSSLTKEAPNKGLNSRRERRRHRKPE